MLLLSLTLSLVSVKTYLLGGLTMCGPSTNNTVAMRFEIDSRSTGVAKAASLQACHAMLTGKEIRMFWRIVVPFTLGPRSSAIVLNPKD